MLGRTHTQLQKTKLFLYSYLRKDAKVLIPFIHQDKPRKGFTVTQCVFCGMHFYTNIQTRKDTGLKVRAEKKPKKASKVAQSSIRLNSTLSSS